MAIKTILAAITLENGEQQVARRAIQLAADHWSRLVLAHAIESLPETDPDLPSPANEDAIAKVLSAEAIASLEQMAERAAVQTELEVECGKADQLIDRLIRDRAADLLVIGQESLKICAKGYSARLPTGSSAPGYVQSWSSSARPRSHTAV